MLKKCSSILLLAAALLFIRLEVSIAGETLEAVRERGFIRVGAKGNLLGFGLQDKNGVWQGLDVDIAKAVAAAVFGDKERVEFIPLTSTERFVALQSGKIDVLCRNTSHTLHRDTALDLDFIHPNYYDGQAFMVYKKLGIKSALDLNEASICVLAGTTTEGNMYNYFRMHGIKYESIAIEDSITLNNAFYEGRCKCITSDSSQLAAIRNMAPDPSKYIILPEIISKEPLSPAVRQGDSQWRDIVEYSFLAMVEAEELGITSKNVKEMLKSDDPRIQRFLGIIPGNGKDLGLKERWVYDIILQVGNYDEIFERNVGSKSPLGLKRGLNQLWTKGGLMYSYPFY